jgi:hypothetical protein
MRVEQNYNSNALAERLMAIFATFARACGKMSLLKLLEQRAAANDISRVPTTATGTPLASTAAVPT